MIFPRWRQSLARSLHVQRSKPEAKFFQVANTYVSELTNELSVANRTVVFRGFVDNSNSLLAITDSRSDKYEQWRQKPESQICWYFTKTREQYRISNTLSLLGQDNESEHLNLRTKVWNTLSGKAQSQFLWPMPKALVSEKPSQVTVNENNIPETFIVLIFNPTSVDYLNLTTDPQTRELHTMDDNNGKWDYDAVNP